MLKLLALLALGFLLAVVVGINVVPPASGYEISLYDAYPPVFWACVVGAFVTSHLVILWSATRDADRTWMLGLAVAFLTYVTLVLMPFVRGYPMYGRDDAMTHLGFIADTAAQGALSGGNIYPNFHLTVLSLSYATGEDPMAVINVVDPVLSIVFFGSLVLLLFQVFETRRVVLFALPFATLPILGDAHLNPRPYDAAVLLLPLVLYLLIRSQRTPTPAIRAAFVVALLALLTYHPLLPVFVIPMLALWIGAQRLDWFADGRTAPATIVLLPLVIAVAWYQNFLSIIFRFRRIYEVVVGLEESSPLAESYSETISETSPALVDLLKKTVVEYGVEGVLFALGFAAVGLYLYQVVVGRRRPDSNTTLFVGILTAFSFGGLLVLFVDLIIPPRRVFQVAKMGAVVLVGGGFYTLWRGLEVRGASTGQHLALGGVLVAALVVLATLTTVGLYPSPMGTNNNPMVSEMELEGTSWVTTYRDPNTDLGQLGMVYARFYHAERGVVSFPGYGTTRTTPPARFNYDEYGTLGESYEEDTLLLIAETARVTYQETFPEYRGFWRYTPENYAQLERDSSVNHVYANGDLDVYRIQGTAPPPAEASMSAAGRTGVKTVE